MPICRYFLDSECLNPNCRFIHPFQYPVYMLTSEEMDIHPDELRIAVMMDNANTLEADKQWVSNYVQLHELNGLTVPIEFTDFSLPFNIEAVYAETDAIMQERNRQYETNGPLSGSRGRPDEKRMFNDSRRPYSNKPSYDNRPPIHNNIESSYGGFKHNSYRSNFNTSNYNKSGYQPQNSNNPTRYSTPGYSKGQNNTKSDYNKTQNYRNTNNKGFSYNNQHQDGYRSNSPGTQGFRSQGGFQNNRNDEFQATRNDHQGYSNAGFNKEYGNSYRKNYNRQSRSNQADQGGSFDNHPRNDQQESNSPEYDPFNVPYK